MVVGSNHHSGIKTTTKLLKPMTLRGKSVQLYRFKCEIYWILPKLAIFTPLPTSTRDVLAITLAAGMFFFLLITAFSIVIQNRNYKWKRCVPYMSLKLLWYILNALQFLPSQNQENMSKWLCRNLPQYHMLSTREFTKCKLYSNIASSRFWQRTPLRAAPERCH